MLRACARIAELASPNASDTRRDACHAATPASVRYLTPGATAPRTARTRIQTRPALRAVSGADGARSTTGAPSSAATRTCSRGTAKPVASSSPRPAQTRCAAPRNAQPGSGVSRSALRSLREPASGAAERSLPRGPTRAIASVDASSRRHGVPNTNPRSISSCARTAGNSSRLRAQTRSIAAPHAVSGPTTRRTAHTC